MSYAAAVSIILIAAIVAAFATAFIHRRVGIDLRRHHHEVGSVVFLQLGVVFAVLLAFVFSEVWGQIALRACNGKIIRIAELASFTSEFRLRSAKVCLGSRH